MILVQGRKKTLAYNQAGITAERDRRKGKPPVIGPSLLDLQSLSVF